MHVGVVLFDSTGHLGQQAEMTNVAPLLALKDLQRAKASARATRLLWPCSWYALELAEVMEVHPTPSEQDRWPLLSPCWGESCNCFVYVGLNSVQ